ncbi:hypothetical protein C5167_040759 [Papaver somniferum]|uniref:Uncharacterized protein n=1 Tax=Papaver somniferum TaxID=3469 RepID=A0A4Y7IFX9_PAPSO|nr:hypothetical protein C5167_040759 [Papaver somniferum]
MGLIELVMLRLGCVFELVLWRKVRVVNVWFQLGVASMEACCCSLKTFALHRHPSPSSSSSSSSSKNRFLHLDPDPEGETKINTLKLITDVIGNLCFQ